MRKKVFILLSIISLGLGLRLFILASRGSLWFDEAFSAHFAALDVGQMLHYLRFENNPPLYFILLHFWIKLFGNSELALRLPSIIFGVASIPMIYILGKRLHSSTAGLFASFLLAISSFQVFYSVETRMYSLYLFLTLLATWLFWRNQEPKKKCHSEKPQATKNPILKITGSIRSLRSLRMTFNALIPYSLFLILLLLIWTHITAWLIILAFIFFLLIQCKFKIKAFLIYNRKFLLIIALLIASFSPWIINFIKLKIISPLSSGYFFYLPPQKNYFLDILETFLVFGQDNAFIVTLLSILIVVLLYFSLAATGWWSGFRRGLPDAVIFLLSWLFLPLFIGFAFSNSIMRYFIAVAPAFYLLLGIGFAQLLEKYKNTQIIFLRWAMPLLFFILIIPDYPSIALASHHQWDKLAQWIEGMQNAECRMQNKCLVLINPHSEILPFERYYKGALPFIGLYPKDDRDDRDMRIVKTNWLSLNTKENIRRLADLTQNFNRVFLVTGGTDPTGQNLVPIWFWQNNWRLTEEKQFGRQSVIFLAK